MFEVRLGRVLGLGGWYLDVGERRHGTCETLSTSSIWAGVTPSPPLNRTKGANLGKSEMSAGI